jgi:hypothetical protein
LAAFVGELHTKGEFKPGMPCWRTYYLPNYEKGPYLVGLFHHCYGDGESFYSRFKACTDGHVEKPFVSPYNLAYVKVWITSVIMIPYILYLAYAYPYIKDG